MIAAFMGTGNAPTNNGASGSVGVEDNIDVPDQAGQATQNGQKRQLLGGLLGGKGKGKGKATGGGGGATGIAGLLGGGGTKAEGPPESRVAASAGQGATSGLPTCGDDGSINMTFRQVSPMARTSSSKFDLMMSRSIRTALVHLMPL